MKVYFRILQFAKPYKTYVIISLIASIVYVLFNGVSLWLIGSLLSSIMNPEAITVATSNSFTDRFNGYIFQFIEDSTVTSQLKFLCYTLIIAFFFKNVFFYINNISLSYAQNGVIMSIRNQLFESTQNFPLSYYKKNKTADLAARMIHDVNMLRNTFTASVQNLFNQPLNILFSIIVLFLINTKLALITLTMIPLSGYVTVKIGDSIRRKGTRSSRSMSELMNIVIENFSGIKVIKAFTRELLEIKKFKEASKDIFNRFLRLDSLKFLGTPINDMIGAVLAAVLLWIGGQAVLIEGTLSADGFIKFITFLFAMLQPAKKLSNVHITINRGIASALRIFKVLDNKETYNESNKLKIDSFNNNITFNNVSFKYEENKNNILHDINTTIKKGEIIAVVGESGAGKTTFVDLIPRYFEVNDGEILFDNKNINDINVFSLRDRISIVSQDNLLFNNTIYNNILFGNKDATEKDVYRAAKIANADEFINSFPKKYDTLVGEKGTKVSGGQKQRIAIARAIIKDPDILILDEATSALDSKAEKKIKEAIDNIIEGRTVIIIAHRLSTIQNADRIIVFDNGEIVEVGNHNELMNLNGKYKQLSEMQFGNLN
tara:strand:+ start:10543 stop:12351 length:1809 start_codon:yes stop_codon:yes gene_type:complete